MSPAKVKELKNPSVKKFHDRFGQHFHSIAWYVDDVQAISTKLDQNNFRLYDIVGKQVKPPHKAVAIWTHPKETPGQLEFALYGDFTPDPRMQPNWSANYWRDQHPLGIERASHITLVVRDLPATRRLYVDVLDGRLIHENEIAGRKKSAFVAVGEDTVIEIAQPLNNDSAEAHDLEKNGEGVHALTFKVRNLQKAMEFLRERQQKPAAEADGSVVLGADQAFGMVVGFTEKPLPGDSR
jgi:catechol 2,3-dioxygenase-like lactoylglutathione lyase family enzyme